MDLLFEEGVVPESVTKITLLPIVLTTRGGPFLEEETMSVDHDFPIPESELLFHACLDRGNSIHILSSRLGPRNRPTAHKLLLIQLIFYIAKAATIKKAIAP
jgi:hypothetical protein